MEIPEIKNPELDNGLIPLSASELKIEEEPETRPFLISFKRYNDRLCEIDASLIKNCQRQALLDMKKIGRCISTNDFKDFGIDYIPVEYRGEYKKLFRGLDESIELYEHKLQGTARIFYFVSDPEKTFYIVAITQTHFETGKTRR